MKVGGQVGGVGRLKGLGDGFRAAEVGGGEREGVGEAACLGLLPGEFVDVGGVGEPVLLVDKCYVGCGEAVLVVDEAFTREPEGLGAAGESIEEVVGGHEAVADGLYPAVVMSVKDGDIELASFGIENGGEVGDPAGGFGGAVGGVFSQDVKRTYGDDSCGGGKMENFCHCHGDSYAGKASGSGAYVDMVDVGGREAVTLEEASAAGEEFGAMPKMAR